MLLAPKRLKLDFKFDKDIPRDSLNMTPYNYFSIKIHLAEICTFTSAI